MLVVFLAGLLARPGRRAARPPPMVVPPRPAVAAVSRTYDVAISAGDGMLWQGELRVGRAFWRDQNGVRHLRVWWTPRRKPRRA